MRGILKLSMRGTADQMPLNIECVVDWGTGHMFQRGAKFRAKAAMGHEDDSNHGTHLFVGELRAGPLMAIRRTIFSVFFVDPWRIDAEVCHDLHLNAKFNNYSNNAASIVPTSMSLPSGFPLHYSS
jgi:hypothetical protein